MPFGSDPQLRDGLPPLMTDKLATLENSTISLTGTATREPIHGDEYRELLALEAQGVQLTPSAREKILQYRRN